MADATLKIIASALNISISTVSRALKDHPDIAEQTKKKIKELALSLDYEPNAFAVQLRTRTSKVLGLLVPTISNFFYHSFTAAVEEECRRNGYSLMILQSGDDPALELQNLRLYRQTRVTGIFACITSTTKEIDLFRQTIKGGIPVVFFDKVPAAGNLSKVCIADEQAATLAADFLISKGKRNILALFGHVNMSITIKRQQAFIARFKGQQQTTLAIKNVTSSAGAEAAMEEAIHREPKPDAVFCMSDEILIGIMKIIQQLQLRVPQDIGIIALSDGFFPTLYYPEISYVETSGHQLGKLAFEHMMGLLHNHKDPEEVDLESILVKKGSM